MIFKSNFPVIEFTTLKNTIFQNTMQRGHEKTPNSIKKKTRTETFIGENCDKNLIKLYGNWVAFPKLERRKDSAHALVFLYSVYICSVGTVNGIAGRKFVFEKFLFTNKDLTFWNPWFEKFFLEKLEFLMKNGMLKPTFKFSVQIWIKVSIKIIYSTKILLQCEDFSKYYIKISHANLKKLNRYFLNLIWNFTILLHNQVTESNTN